MQLAVAMHMVFELPGSVVNNRLFVRLFYGTFSFPEERHLPKTVDYNPRRRPYAALMISMTRCCPW